MPKFMTKPCTGPGCDCPKCMDKGGELKNRDHMERGVNRSVVENGGMSKSRPLGPHKDWVDQSKDRHRAVISELQSMRKPKLYAEGGRVDSGKQRHDNEKGVHKELGRGIMGKGQSVAGRLIGTAGEGMAKTLHEEKLKEMREMPKPKLMAEGGEVEDGEPQTDEELHHAIGGELMDALERKDKKGIMEALHAAVMSCMDKE